MSHVYPFHAPKSHFLKTHLTIIFPSTPGSPKWSLSLRFPHQYPVYASSLLHRCYVFHPSHSSRFNHTKNIGSAQIMKLLIMKFSPLSCYLVPFRPIYSPQHSILKHPQPMLLPQCEWPCFTPAQNNRQNYSSVYLNFIFLDSTLEDKIPCTEW